MVSAGALLVCGLAALLAHAQATPGITDFFSWGLDYLETESKSGESSPSLATRECSCEGPACTCCVNFNLTFVDLGGPGCVKLKYLSQEEGLMVNVSYGDNVLHSEKVKGPKPEPACMDLLSDLAQVCARFTHLTAEGTGLKGCTLLEPTLLGDPQAQYPLGCFTAGPDGMRLDPTANVTEAVSQEEDEEEEDEEESSQTSESEGDESTDKPDLSEEALISAVNQSAEEGIAWFTSLLGLSFGGGGGKKNATETEPTPTPAPIARAQRARNMNEIPLKK